MQNAFRVYPNISNILHRPFAFSIYINPLASNEAPTCWFVFDKYDTYILACVYRAVS